MLLLLMNASCNESPDESLLDASSEPCRTDDDCNDGVFCNGVETCSPSTATAVDGCIEGGRPCGDAECDENAQICIGACSVDADGDGAVSTSCGGDDCDDDDPIRFPGNLEVCDPDGVDEDCNPTTFGTQDEDGDGFTSAMCCNTGDDGTARCGDDCDDANGTIRPGNGEICNGIDEDCDGRIDEGTWPDETCNDSDDDCDGVIDEGVTIDCWLDNDGDGHAALDEAPLQRCPDEGRSGEPFRACPSTYTGTPPSDALPEPTFDCDDGTADQQTPTLCYRDTDRDTFGAQGSNPVSHTCDSDCPAGQASRRGDCCDSDSDAKPEVTTYATVANACGSYDWNCDGVESRQYVETASGFCGPGGGSGRLCLCSGGVCRGFSGAPPACGNSDTYIDGCSGLGLDCSADSEVRQQACR